MDTKKKGGKKGRKAGKCFKGKRGDMSRLQKET